MGAPGARAAIRNPTSAHEKRGAVALSSFSGIRKLYDADGPITARLVLARTLMTAYWPPSALAELRCKPHSVIPIASSAIMRSAGSTCAKFRHTKGIDWDFRDDINGRLFFNASRVCGASMSSREA